MHKFGRVQYGCDGNSATRSYDHGFTYLGCDCHQHAKPHANVDSDCHRAVRLMWGTADHVHPVDRERCAGQ